MAVTVTWINHASFRIASDKAVVYIDPWKIEGKPLDGDVVLVSHSHYDHLSPEDIAKVARQNAAVLGPEDVTARLTACQTLVPGQRRQFGAVKVEAVAAYNLGKKFHPPANNWLGWIVELAGRRIYYAGDSDLIAEMGELGALDLALLPVGGTYTMDAEAAAQAARQINPKRAVPYHWGDIVGQRADAEQFAKAVGPAAVVLAPGEALTLD